jgi:mono/diheme cytochrome c family protein
VPVDASFFAVSVHPILDTYCIDCHGEEKQKGDIRLDSQEALGGVNENDDPILTVGNPEDSGLYSSMLLPDDDDYHMPPPKKPQPSAEEIELIKWWIESGADFEKTADELKLSDNPKAAPPSP